MPVSSTPVTERIARVLAGQRLSINADGEDPSAHAAVDMEWRDHLDDARAVLRTLREPDEAMARAGDTATWAAMIHAALDGDPAPSPYHGEL